MFSHLFWWMLTVDNCSDTEPMTPTSTTWSNQNIIDWPVMTLHVARAKGSLVKDTNHVATCLARHGAKADYLHQRGGVIWWGNWIADIVTNSRKTLKGCRLNETWMMTWLFNVLELQSPDDVISWHLDVQSITYHYAKTWKSLSCHVHNQAETDTTSELPDAVLFASSLGQACALDSDRFSGKINFLMNFSNRSNPRLSKTTESFQTNFNLCLVSFDCAIKGRLCRGREPTTSPRERSGIEKMSWQWFHIRLLRSADQNVWMVPLAGSCFRILYLTGWSRFSIAPTRALLLNTSLNNDEFIFSFLSALLCLKKLETNKFLVFFQGQGDFEIMFFCWM